MKHIVILSSLLYPLDFQQAIKRGEFINPSHQQYMSRFAQALSLQHQVTVVTLPPAWKTIKKITIPSSWHRLKNLLYLQFSWINLPWLRLGWLALKTNRYIRKILKKQNASLILFVDGNSRLAGVIAKRWRRHPRVTTIGIITDDPRQLSGNSKMYVNQSMTLHRHYHRYVALTPALLSTLGVQDHPHVFAPGFVEKSIGASHHKKPYFFFSGALYERYGIHALVQGFLDLNQDALELIIAGYGPESSFIEAMAQQHRHLKFLGLISPEEALKYQAGAYANINPRPLEKNFDEVSIPSKVLDYIASGVPTLTTEHPFLKATFQETLDWIEDSSSAGIRVALFRFLQDDYGLHQAKAIQAQKLALKHFGLTKVGQDLAELIKDIK